jgi:hypothetical protein
MTEISHLAPRNIEANKIAPRPRAESMTRTNVAITKTIRSAIAEIKIT